MNTYKVVNQNNDEFTIQAARFWIDYPTVIFEDSEQNKIAAIPHFLSVQKVTE